MITATVAQVEGMLIRKNRDRLARVNFSILPSTGDAPNSHLLDAISLALEAMGLPVAAPGSPTDAEVGAASGLTTLVGVSQVYLLESMLDNWTDVDENEQSRSASSSDLMDSIAARIAQLRKQYEKSVPGLRTALGPVVGGVLRVRTTARRRWGCEF